MPRLMPPVALLVVLLVLAAPPAVAAGPTLALTSSATKAKVGDDVIYTVRAENTGTETIPNLRISLGLPDALDAQSVSCPGTPETVTDCLLDSLAPGASVEVGFVVRVGSRVAAVNGDVTATASSSGSVLANARLPKLKIIGPPR